MAQKTQKFDRHGNARLVEDATEAVNARFNGFVFDKAPTEKQAAAVTAAHGGTQK